MEKQFNKNKMISNLQCKYPFVLDHQINEGIYIYGTGLLGQFCERQCVANNVPINGFIDSNASSIIPDYINNIALYPLEKVGRDSIIIIANFYWYDLKTKLINLGYSHFLYYEELALMEIGFEVYYMGFDKLFEIMDEEEQNYLKILEYLNDEKSKEIYTKVLNFRKTLNVDVLKEAYNLSIIDGNQYFDKKVPLSENEVFLDGGGFDGATSLEFIDCCKEKYKRIFFFEPDSRAMENAKRVLGGYENISFYQAGVGQRCEKLFFNNIGDGASTLSEEGAELIDIMNIDVLQEHFTYIKLDIEGSEMQALRGAEETIKTYKPKLAISIYHHPEDLFGIFSIINAYNSNYKYYIRHYTVNYADTVLYCI